MLHGHKVNHVGKVDIDLRELGNDDLLDNCARTMCQQLLDLAVIVVLRMFCDLLWARKCMMASLLKVLLAHSLWEQIGNIAFRASQ